MHFRQWLQKSLTMVIAAAFLTQLTGELSTDTADGALSNYS